MESAIFPGMTANLVGQMQKNEPWCACNPPLHFSGETKEIIFVEPALERELYAKVSIGSKKLTTWPCIKKKAQGLLR